MSTAYPKGSFFAERYLYDEKDKEGIVPQVTRLLFDGRASLKNKMKAAKKAVDHDIASTYPESIVCDTSYDSASKTLKCDFWVRAGALAREIMMECRVERG